MFSAECQAAGFQNIHHPICHQLYLNLERERGEIERDRERADGSHSLPPFVIQLHLDSEIRLHAHLQTERGTHTHTHAYRHTHTSIMKHWKRND